MRRILIALLFFIMPLTANAQFGGEGAFSSVSDYLKRVNTDTKPSADSTYNLGSSSKKWNTLNINSIVFSDGSQQTSSPAIATDWTSAPSVVYLTRSGDNVGLGVSGPVNKLDVSGSAAIGATYAGTNTAPSNGLIVQGNEGIGTSVPNASFDIVKTNNGSTTQFMRLTSSGSSSGTGEYLSFYESPSTEVSRIESLDGGDTTAGLRFWTYSAGLNASPTMFINGKGNVGIGSLNPGQVLDVNGTARVAAGSAALPSLVGLTGGNSTGAWFPAANTMAFSTNGVESMRINSSGNIGINTTVPAEIFNINGSTRSLGRWDRAGTLIGYIGEPDLLWPSATPVPLNSEFGVMANTNLYLGSNANTNPSIFIKGSSNNVGIGTTIPASKLEVNGSIYTSNNQFFGSRGASSGTYGLISLNTSNNIVIGDTTNNNVIFNNGSGNVGIGTSSPGNVQGLSILGGLSVGSYATTATPVGTSAIFSGQVGIGISAPSAGTQLHIGSANSGWLKIEGTGAANYSVLENTTTTGHSYVGLERSTAGGLVAGSTPNSLIVDNINNFPIDFYTNNTRRATLDINGNLGIGTTGPQASLTVGSTGQFQVNSTGGITDGGNVGINSTLATPTNVRITNGIITTWN